MGQLKAAQYMCNWSLWGEEWGVLDKAITVDINHRPKQSVQQKPAAILQDKGKVTPWCLPPPTRWFRDHQVYHSHHRPIEQGPGGRVVSKGGAPLQFRPRWPPNPAQYLRDAAPAESCRMGGCLEEEESYDGQYAAKVGRWHSTSVGLQGRASG